MHRTTLQRLRRRKTAPKFLLKLALLTGVPIKAVGSRPHKVAAAHHKIRMLRAAVG